jgi:prepilin-type N-terminal cleavage/methylation domain-containing protein
MKKLMTRGFTLIELLVVIAIIGILAAVVLGSLSDARQGGQDASIKQTMASLRSQAEIFYNGTGGFSYSGVCADADIASSITGALNVVNGDPYVAANDTNTLATNSATTDTDKKAMCNANSTAYQITVPLADGSAFWCVDSNGRALEVATSPAVGDVACS